MKSNTDFTPVIVGVGEITEKVKVEPGMEPMELMLQSLERAEADTGCQVLGQLDSVDIINEYSWPYENPEALLCDKLGFSPARVVYGKIGGESPLRFMYQAALRIASGESSLSAIVGGEAAYSAMLAQRQQKTPPWTPRHPNPPLTYGRDVCHSEAVKYGATEPVHVYPFYENATQAEWGLTQQQALDESGRCWEGYSRVASENPESWIAKPLTAADITTPSDKNRLICWPYTKSMVANMFVNQGAAVILTSVGKARELGIPEAKWVYLADAAFASEPRDYLARDTYHHSKAQSLVLDAVCKKLPKGVDSLNHLELYSCFPVVPKMARRHLGLSEDATLSCAGGLSFFGAPLNNYMTHAAVAMVRKMREAESHDSLGLLYGQGEFVTKHFTLLLAKQNPGTDLPDDCELTGEVEENCDQVPTFITHYAGPATLETFTVIFNHRGEVDRGVVIALTPDRQRVMAEIPAQDGDNLAVLMDLQAQPVGMRGQLETTEGGLNRWGFTR